MEGRRRVLVGALGALVWLLLEPGPALLTGPADLGPVMPEVDGVHPARAVQALREAYAPGVGFLDKYPPLGSALMGLAVLRVDSEFADQMGDVAELELAERQELEWELADRIPPILSAQRQISRHAMAAAVGIAMALAAALALRIGARPIVADLIAPVLVLVAFGRTYPVLYYGTTANVDALALCAALGALASCVGRRVLLAATLAAVATAIKDPAFVVGPVVLVAAWRAGGWRRTGLAALVGLSVYAVLSGALTAPTVWWTHVSYLVSGGVEGVARVDPLHIREWPGLLAYTVRLLLGAVGAAVLVVGVAGIGWLGRRDPFSSAMLAGVIGATLALFILPAGFVFVRFLLLPLAMIGIGAGLAVAAIVEALLSWADKGPTARKLYALGIFVGGTLVFTEAYGFATRSTTWAGAPAAQVEELRTLVFDGEDPRAEAVAGLEHYAIAGSRVAVFADGRSHGPPLDPTRWDLEVRGLGEAEASLGRWMAGPAEERPQWILVMSFPTDLPSGEDVPAGEPPAEGEAVAVAWRVREVYGRPTRCTVERTLACRPTVTLLELSP